MNRRTQMWLGALCAAAVLAGCGSGDGGGGIRPIAGPDKKAAKPHRHGEAASTAAGASSTTGATSA